ncbi:MAG: phosphoribosylamine--glycine ligase [Alphaproteobacteria bacterium]
MNILLIGSGSREHALAKAVAKSPSGANLFCLSNATNPGIKKLTADYKIASVTDVDAIVEYAVEKNIDITLVGPEAPLEVGVADGLKAKGIKVVGPTKDHAQLESSKGFTRQLITDYKIDGNPFFKQFNSMDGVVETLAQYEERFVIKADGLCGGKGVVVWGDHLNTMDEAIKHCEELIAGGNEFVIEEKIDGQEFSLISFCDGKNLIHMPAVQDHKRAFVGDTGPNTGGMGTYSDANHLLPFLSESDCEKAQNINQAVADALHDKFGTPYQGILYGGFMATKDGVKVIEYNARFGDPEAMNLLTLFNGDFVDVAKGIVDGNLNTVNAVFDKKATVCKYVVPNGYPDASQKGFKVDISKVSSDVELFMGSVDEKDGDLIAMGSRTIAVLGVADTIAQAEQLAETAVGNIEGELFHRPDVGTNELINKRIQHMNKLRGNIYKEL